MTSETMRALSVRQPWAEAIRSGKKKVENRGSRIHLRGLLAIHAPAKVDDLPLEAFEWVSDMLGVPDVTAAKHNVRSAVVAVVNLSGCHRHGDLRVPCGGSFGLCSPWAVRGQWHWEFTDVRPLPDPVRCRGHQGVWWLPPEVDAAVRAQVGLSTV